MPPASTTITRPAAATYALAQLEDATQAASSDLTPVLVWLLTRVHDLGASLLPRVHVLGAHAPEARTAITSAARHATSLIAAYRALPEHARRRRPTDRLAVEAPAAAHTAVAVQLRRLVDDLTALDRYATAAASLRIAAAETAVDDVSAVIARVTAAGEYDARPVAAAPVDAGHMPRVWHPGPVALSVALFAAIAGAVTLVDVASAGPAPVQVRSVGSLVGDPLDTASPADTAAPTTVDGPAVTPTPDPCAGLPAPDRRYPDYRARWVADGYPVGCLPRLAFEGAVGPDADAARQAWADEHPEDPVYGAEAAAAVRAWRRLRSDTSAAVSAWADRPTPTGGTP